MLYASKYQPYYTARLAKKRRTERRDMLVMAIVGAVLSASLFIGATNQLVAYGQAFDKTMPTLTIDQNRSLDADAMTASGGVR